jgi:hypothetical protein
METIKGGVELPKRKRWRPRKNPLPEIAQTLEESEEITPNWKIFNIQEIAEINPGTTQIINLKNVRTNKNWEKYISINWRKYYEFKWQWEPKDSMYILKWNSLFIWDKFEWLTNRDWVSFRYSEGIGEHISFEQRKTKYAWWAMHLKEMYKSESLYSSEILTLIRHGWKLVKITKNMIDKYLAWQLNNTLKKAVETAIITSPDVFAYMETIKK